MTERRTSVEKGREPDPFSEKSCSDFKRVRKEYRSRREQMVLAFRNLLIEQLQSDGRYTVKDGSRGRNRGRGTKTYGTAGRGSTKYEAKNDNDHAMASLYASRFKGPDSRQYDLSDWLWIEIVRNGRDWLLVSFQAPDRDRGSRNHHALQDRIALIDAGADGFDGSGHFEDTGIELPLDKQKADRLIALIEERLERMEEAHGA